MKRYNRPLGVTLIMVAGVLAVLAALGTGFYSMMLMQTRSATRYSDSVRAEMLAKGGVEAAIARLREQAFERTESPSDPWYQWDYTNGKTSHVSFPAYLDNKIDDDGDGITDNLSEAAPFSGAMGNSAGDESDRYTLHITDASSRINLNACDNLAVLLDNLCRVVGAPLVPADLDALQPRRWATEVLGGDPTFALYSNPKNQQDTETNRDLYYWLYNASNTVTTNGSGRPLRAPNGSALYGDGYAIAAWRGRNGRFKSIEDVKSALTYVERNGNDVPDTSLERLEVEVKFAALREYITLDSWIDTNTVCVGKFEWAQTTSSGTFLIDRDKSWVSSVNDAGALIVDPDNVRGTLRGSYISIMNGHGAGQLRRIEENGIDWIKVQHDLEVLPGPISSYMIIAQEDALRETVSGVTPATEVPKLNADGTLVDHPDINYQLRPLCIHRAPINMNTASDKVLAALFLGINVQHGHPLAVGTDADLNNLRKVDPGTGKLEPAPADGSTLWQTKGEWKVAEYTTREQEPYLLTMKGVKRIPPDSGKPVLDRPVPWLPADDFKFGYISNFGTLESAFKTPASKAVNEAHELAWRIITARQRKVDPVTGKPVTASDADVLTGYEKGPFKSWDDFYFRVVRPWDDDRLNPLKNPESDKKVSVARMIMAHFNSNTDILKFNPNIEWIDRWGRNFTELEPVMFYRVQNNNPSEPWFEPGTATSMWAGYQADAGKQRGAYYARSMRYKTDELIDKTDLNRSTTEFSFDSGGIYEIQSIGQVTRRGQVLSERRVDALVKVYDVWRESTQRQFVQGTILRGPAAPMPVRGTTYSGQVTRHADLSNPKALLPLVTLPEPLVPLSYTIDNPKGLADVVAGASLNAWGSSKSANVPDVIANRVMPAQYDGQICLATNTTAYDPNGPDKDTFLASFNGDLDTDTSMANGREQAKTPKNKKFRVLDTISLLGLLNDREVDFDPDTWPVFASSASNTVLRILDKTKYWENVTCRMGDLRSEGVFLGNVGCSGKDATLKYLVMNSATERNWDPGNETGTGHGAMVSMWFKSTWHVDDHMEHEFFNATNKGDGWGARYNNLVKYGRYSWACPTTAGKGGNTHASDDCLSYNMENSADADIKLYMHGGTRNVPYTTRESPSFHVQPFRWGFVGGMCKYNQAIANAPNYSGFFDNMSSAGLSSRDDAIQKMGRPFIDTYREPEGAGFKADYYWKQTDTANLGGNADIGETNRQEAAWSWADGATNGKAVFGANNLNKSMTEWLYRATPLDGTLSVIDEFKLTRTSWDSNRIHEEMTRSRYYMPPNPSSRNECPQFVSQSLLQSLRGFDKTLSAESVTVARVHWNVFTPRFMWEFKEASKTRKERIKSPTTAAQDSQPRDARFRGPFDYIQYNMDILPPDGEGIPEPPKLPINAPLKELSVDRPTPKDYGALPPHASRGVEVELLSADAGDSGAAPIGGITYTDPDALNVVGTANAPVKVKTNKLRYRVRFVYPVDPLVAARYGEGSSTVAPARHYMLDTPVFDDISITYFSKPRILSFKEVTE